MKRIKYNLEPKVFSDYKELFDMSISLCRILPIFEDYNITGYKVGDISDIEEEYRWLCKEFFDNGIITEKQIINRFNYPSWIASEIIRKQKEIGIENLMSNCFYI